MSRTRAAVSRSRRIGAAAAAVLLTACVSAVGQQEHVTGAEPQDPSDSRPGSSGAGTGEERVDGIEAIVEDSTERPLAQGDCTGKGGASIRVAGEDLFLPLDELKLIQREVERFLADEDPELEPSVFGPGEAFVDCWGVARMGAWILEAGHDPNELSLAFRIHTGESVIVRQVVALERRDEVWRATGVSRQISHLRR